jgi:hypothetical protein
VSDYVDWDALWRVLALGLVFGAGVVALFSVAIVGLDSAETGVGRIRGRAVAVICFALCALAVVYGIWVMLDK